MKYLFLLAVTIMLAGCGGEAEIGPSGRTQQASILANDDTGTEPVQGAAHSKEESESFQGQIGMLIDARKLASYGYNPVSAIVDVENLDLPGYPREVELGRYSFMGSFSLDVADLSHYEENLYADGVSFNISLYDNERTLILDKTVSRVVLQANPGPIELFDNNLPDRNPEFRLSETTEYFIQQVKNDGTPLDAGWRYNGNPHRDAFTIQGGLNQQVSNPINESAKPYLFTFEEFHNDPGYYAIKSVGSGRYLRVTEHTQKQGDAGNGNRYRFTENFVVLGHETIQLDQGINFWNTYKFRVEKERDGVYIILAKTPTADDLPIRNLNGWPASGIGSATGTWGLTVDTTALTHWYLRSDILGNPIYDYAKNHSNTSPTRWRIVSSSIDWQLRNIGAEVVQSIVPEPSYGVSYESTENNCSSGDMITTAGIEKTSETTVYTDWSESLSTLTSEEYSTAWEISLGLSGAWGPSFSASLSGSHTVRTENSKTSTTTVGNSTTESTTISSSKEITVPAYTRAEISVEYENYEDIEVVFVQRLQLSGSDIRTGNYLTGNEIRSQLEATKFEGVVLAVEEDMVEISLQGTATIQNLVKGNTVVIGEDCT